LFALAAPLAWKGRPGEESAALRRFAAAIFLLFVIFTTTLCLFVTASSRYDVDFLPALLLLAVIGIFGLERALAQSAFRRSIARCVWCGVLAYSLVFNILATIDAHAAIRFFVGNYFFHQGNLTKAIENFSEASMLEPNAPGFHFSLASALSQAGQRDDAIKYFRRASELQNNYQTFYNLAFALRMNKMAVEAETNLEKAIELQPQFIPAQIDLSWTLATWPDATARDGGKALVIAKDLDRQHADDPKILRALAAAYAETGDFPKAVVAAKQAVALAQAQSRSTLLKELQSETILYQSNSPCRTFSN
jgi:tetratricopeptide (TPR) repeat protein